MIRRTTVLITGLLLILGACASAPAPVADAPPWRLVAADRIADARHLVLTVDLAEPARLAALSEALEAAYPIELVAEWPLRSIEVHCLVFVLRPEADPAAVIQTLASDGRVRTVQRMQTFETLAISYRDELVELQSGLKALEALPAHAVATGRGVRIGIVDSGLDTAHPDLADRIALARDFVQAPAESADPSSPTDPEEHGTAVAGVIGADGANASGMVGVAPGAEILGLRGCWQEGGRGDGYCSSFSLARALNFALLNDVDVLNLSLGGPPDPLIEALVEAAIEQGIVVVAAHGETADTQFPASVEGAIAVASQPLGAEGTTLARLRASLAIGAAGNAGPLTAPGVDILSTTLEEGYDFFSGSSIAAAHVSGVVALMLEARPGLSPAAASEALAIASGKSGPVSACAALAALDVEIDATDCVALR